MLMNSCFDDVCYASRAVASVLTEVLAENNRLNELNRISDVFDDIMAAVRGEVKATITTAEVGTTRGLDLTMPCAIAHKVLRCHPLPPTMVTSQFTVSCALAAD